MDLVKHMNLTMETNARDSSVMLNCVVWIGSSIAFETRPHTQTGHLLLTDPESKYRVFIYFTEALLPCLVCSWLIRCWFAKTVCVIVCDI